MIVFGAQIVCQQTFLALRKVILLVPLTFIIPDLFGDKLLGTLAEEPISDTLATLTTVTCFYFVSKKLFKNKNEEILY